MDDHSNPHRLGGPNLTKPYTPNTFLHNGMNLPTQSQPRMSYNAHYSATNKEGPSHK